MKPYLLTWCSQPYQRAFWSRSTAEHYVRLLGTVCSLWLRQGDEWVFLTKVGQEKPRAFGYARGSGCFHPVDPKLQSFRRKEQPSLPDQLGLKKILYSFLPRDEPLEHVDTGLGSPASLTLQSTQTSDEPPQPLLPSRAQTDLAKLQRIQQSLSYGPSILCFSSPRFFSVLQSILFLCPQLFQPSYTFEASGNCLRPIFSKIQSLQALSQPFRITLSVNRGPTDFCSLSYAGFSSFFYQA